MAKIIIMWVDRDGDPHTRLLESTESEAERAIDLLSQKYDEDFFNARWLLADAGFTPFSVIEGEYAEYLADRAADEAYSNEGGIGG